MQQTLSSVLGRMNFKMPIIKAVNCNISELDTIPSQYIVATQLLLSQNKIVSLAGLVQFQCLEKLSLSANRVDDFDEITYLEPLPNLISLRMDLNPISTHPLYRLKLINMLPQLQDLDGIQITQNDKLQACIILEEVFQKDQLLIQEIQTILNIKNSKLDPQRVLYEKVLKEKSKRSRAPWRSIYDAISVQVQNELATCNQNMNFSLYRTQFNSTNGSTKLPQQSVVQFQANQTPKVNYQQTSEVQNNNSQCMLQQNQNEQLQLDSSFQLTQPQTLQKSQFLNEDLLHSDTYREQIDKSDVLKMKNQLETLKNQILEHQKINQDNIQQSLQKINTLNIENDKKQNSITDLQKANKTYQQSIIESKQKSIALEKLLQEAQQALKATQMTAKTETTKITQLSQHCELLATEILTFKKTEKFQKNVQKLRFSWAFQLFKSNTLHQISLKNMSQNIDFRSSKKLKILCFQQLRQQFKLSQKADFYLLKTQNLSFRNSFKKWRQRNILEGFKPVRVINQDKIKADELNKYICKFIPFRIMTISIRKLLFKNRQMDTIEKNIDKKCQFRIKNIAFAAYRSKFTAPRKLGQNLDKMVGKWIKRAYFQNWSKITQRKENAIIISQQLHQQKIQQLVSTSFLEWKQKNNNFKNYNIIIRQKQLIFASQKLKIWREKLSKLTQQIKFNQFLTTKNANFTAKHSCAQNRLIFSIWRLKTRSISHSKRNFSTLKNAFQAWRTQLVTKLKANFTNFKQKSITNQLSASNINEKLQIQTEQNRVQAQQLAVLRKEIAKFHSQAKFYCHENDLLRTKMASNSINSARKEAEISKLRSKVEIAFQSEFEGETANYQIQSEVLQVEIQTLRNAVSGLQSENQRLKQSLKDSNNQEIVQELIQRSQNLYNNNLSNSSQMEVLRDENERQRLENEVLRATLNQKGETVDVMVENMRRELANAKGENAVLVEKVKNLDIERRAYIQQGLGACSEQFEYEDISQRLIVEFL
ncbi:putative U2 small nuclear ribonucleoprotein A' [Spironucleus salmonicida]|uniref:U2 small nuclear ribonucleoprotein A n=1 Tax=Spironucleus salmonicida TaxID=348837 RepID=V6LFW4_9EUKA|nr:putative U2 small nuclear ribonucleoprotein A' [Spironucleus salmonicida]|eukprot:EST42596.1 Putative U2 small nuclear ribonucleoprotein A' [Spironucleus salmonicida]